MHVVSTAGHVDHGKSTLIRLLTGIDPDRLAEEKQRGLTIDLGFAWMALPSGREIGIVDVPGHERFVHNMLAGVGSVDTTMFAVAANEGWKPQSEEHLAILEMLGARGGVVALTKADLVSEEALEAAREAVARRLAGTCLDGCAIVPVSGVTGAGTEDLLQALDAVLDRIGEPEVRARPRVFVDRSFTVNGVGTVVTGTLTGGSIRTGDSLVVLPAGHRARIRGIQTHRRVLDEAHPVSRVALNLAGLERASVVRGDAVVAPGQWQSTTELDVRLRAVRSLDHEIVNRGAYKLHIGSAEIDARLSLYDAASVPPGGEAFARLVLVQPTIAAPLDRFVLRDVGRRQTIGGGQVLDPHPPALRGPVRATRVTQLRARAGAAPDQFPTLVVAERGAVERADLEWMSGSAEPPDGAVSLRTLEVSKELFAQLTEAIDRTLRDFHARQRLVRGMSREEAREASGVKSARLFAELVESMKDRVVAEGPLLRLRTHHVTLTLEQEAARDILIQQIEDGTFSPPSLAALMDEHGEGLVRALIEDGTLTKVSDDIVFTSAQVEKAKRVIAEATAVEGPLTAARIKDLLGTTRKYAIPLLEHLDAAGFTRRRGDLRELVG